jgi:exopolyphosphatase/guanosine-5'-triphosphate,3'-diphosphate pyrophosphatase
LSHKLKKAYPIHEKNLFIVELGAGSLDVSIMEKGSALFNLGIPVGTLVLKQFMNSLDGSMEEIYGALNEYVDNEILYLEKLVPQFNIDDVILIDENYSRFLENILPNRKRDSDFFSFSKREAGELYDTVINNSPDQFGLQYDFPREISETIAGYAVVINALFKILKRRNIYILETSLSEAILANELLKVEVSKKTDKKNQLISVANFLCGKYGVDLKHAKKVVSLSEILFSALKESLGLTDDDSLYLILAAYLHDIGMFVNNRSHHKHSEYLISSFTLFRLTEEEIKTIACIARYHRKAPPLKTHLAYNSLSLEKQIVVQKLSALLRVANSLDISHKQKVKKLEVELTKNQEVVLNVSVNDSFVLEQASFYDKKRLFEEVTGNRLNLIVKTEGNL